MRLVTRHRSLVTDSASEWETASHVEREVAQEKLEGREGGDSQLRRNLSKNPALSAWSFLKPSQPQHMLDRMMENASRI